jgi:hypothetical protein
MPKVRETALLAHCTLAGWTCFIFRNLSTLQAQHLSFVRIQKKTTRRAKIKKKKISTTTSYRRKAVTAGRVCPFCCGPLMEKRNGPKPDERGLCRIHCYRSLQDRRDFSARLNASEIDKFRTYSFNTDEWLRMLPGKKCPECGSQLYLRKLHFPDGRVEFYEICRRSFKLSIKYTCNYFKKLINGNTI